MGQSGYTLMTWLSLPIFVSSVRNDWKPLKSKSDFIIEPKVLAYTRNPTRKIAPPLLNTCSLYKAKMDQHTFHQYIQYKHHIPELNEFTLCVWYKLFSYYTDHVLFSYELPQKPRIIFSRIANTPKKSYYMLSINGHTIYRINFPTKLFKWYHMCQSWNGKTGEWQLWINNERISRGYYNLMVGKIISNGGIAITGQERLEYEDEFFVKKKRIGLQGELTLLQLYKAALSKGKAYSDHKHHHVHDSKNDEIGEEEENTTANGHSTIAPDSISYEHTRTTEHIFIENGQLKPSLPVHELLVKNNIESEHDKIMLPFESLLDSAKLLTTKNLMMSVKRSDIDEFNKIMTNEKELKTNSTFQDVKSSITYQFNKNESIANKNERMLLITDETSPLQDSHSHSDLGGFFAFYSKPNGKSNREGQMEYFNGHQLDQERFVKLEYEPAEWEVRKIADVCSACEEDPFHKANVLSWQETPKKLFAGAQYIPAISKCHIF